MGELISAAVITQIVRIASEVAATLGKSTALGAALAQEGLDVDVLGRLLGALSLGALSLRPREQYAAALVHAAPLHGRFASRFLAQVLPDAVPTVQVSLLLQAHPSSSSPRARQAAPSSSSSAASRAPRRRASSSPSSVSSSH